MPKNVDWVGLIRESKPMIAAVNGAAVGIGITMILPFDIIMASKKAKFGMFFIQMGLVPELASSHFLIQRMGNIIAINTNSIYPTYILALQRKRGTIKLN